MLRTLLLLVALLASGATAYTALAQDGATPVVATPVEPVDPDAAATYCESQGGEVRERTPVLGSDLPPEQQIELGIPQLFCEFSMSEGDDPPSWISVSLEALYTEAPTLATLAYLTTPPSPVSTGSANPSSVYCDHLGGAYDFTDVPGAPGGWVTQDPEPAIPVQNYCVFPDGSMIDAWGLTYHTGGMVRGADLTPLLRYQPDDPPMVFPAETDDGT